MDSRPSRVLISCAALTITALLVLSLVAIGLAIYTLASPA
jgi:hypothetical protein